MELKRVSATIPAEDMDKLKELSKKQAIPITILIRIVVRQYLEKA